MSIFYRYLNKESFFSKKISELKKYIPYDFLILCIDYEGHFLPVSGFIQNWNEKREYFNSTVIN